MLGVKGPLTQPAQLLTSHPSYLQSTTGFSPCFSVFSSNHRSRYSYSRIYIPPSCICGRPLLLARRNFCLRAQKKQSYKGRTVSEGEDSIDLNFEADDDIDYDDAIDDEIEEEDDDEDDEDDDIVLEPGEMKAWISKEPRGFGVGKVYDTSVEDKLLEEIERSRKAQPSNMNELKIRVSDLNKNKAKKEDSHVIASGICVRISQLPKKKNIQRDLNAAFKGIPGIVNITPVVSGNKKTRDPVCKGLAFVDFKSADDANRFIGVFSSQNIGFGKVMKQIKCELLSSSAVESSQSSTPEVYNEEGNVSEVHSPSHSEQVNLNDGSDDSAVLDDEHVKRILEDLSIKLEQGSDSMKLKVAQDVLSSPEEDNRTRKANKPRTVKKKKTKVTASKISKAPKRLKAKEKSMFVDVLSRYGSDFASAAKDSR